MANIRKMLPFHSYPYRDHHEGYLGSRYRESPVFSSYPQPFHPSVHVTPPTFRQQVFQHHPATQSIPTDSSRHPPHHLHDSSGNDQRYEYVCCYPQEEFYERASSFGSTQHSHPSSLPFDKNEEYEIRYAREIYNRNHRSYPCGSSFNNPSELELQRLTNRSSHSPSCSSSISRYTRHSLQYNQHIPPQHQSKAATEDCLPSTPTYSDYYSPKTATIPTSTPIIPPPPSFPLPLPTTMHRNNAYTTQSSALDFSSPSSPSSFSPQTCSKPSVPVNNNTISTVSVTDANVESIADVNSKSNMNTDPTRREATEMDEIVSFTSPLPVISSLPRKETRREKKLRRKQMAIKTKLCRNYLKGFCQFGKNCHFAHGQEELRPNN